MMTLMLTSPSCSHILFVVRNVGSFIEWQMLTLLYSIRDYGFTAIW